MLFASQQYTSPTKEGISFHKDKWIVLMFLAALLGAASALYDKYLLQRAMLDPVAMQAWFSVYMLLIVSVILAALKELFLLLRFLPVRKTG